MSVATLLARRQRLLDEQGAFLKSLDTFDAADEAKNVSYERQINHLDKQIDLGRRLAGGAGDTTAGSSFGGRGEVFTSFGEQLRAIVEAGRPGGSVDSRLHQVLAASGMSEAVPTDGGFLLESAFASEIMRRVYDTAAVASRCRRFPIGAGASGIKLPYVEESSRATGSRWGGVRVYRANEADTVTATKPKLNRIELVLEKLMGLCYITDELLQDARALEAFVTEAFSDEIGFTVDDEIINGNGTGKCLGILQSPALVTVAKENGQAADSIVYQNVRKMWSRCWGRSRRNAVWYVNQDCEDQLYSMHLEIGTGGSPVFLPAGGASEAPFSTLFRRPIIPIEQCSSIGDVGDIILADMSQYLLADKQVQTATSMHVRFIYDEMAFRTTYRVNGQPWWKSALTPFKGNNTLSPFVVLEAR